ncbi:MAG: hypothetical protein P4M14_07370 [Gammaproteobacteria bacterium]|nr:hypothetical protein [Gammaproteobacteria bacterium]
MISNHNSQNFSLPQDDFVESKLDGMPLMSGEDLTESKQDGIALQFDENCFENKPLAINTMEGLVKIGLKAGGANGAGILGGWYIDPNGKKFFIKQDVSNGIIRGVVADKINHAKNISEVIVSRLMRLIDAKNKDSIAEVNFIVPDSSIVLPDPDGNNVYVASAGMGAEEVKEDKEAKEELDLEFLSLYEAYQERFDNSLPDYETVYKKLYESPYLDLWEDAYLAYNFSPQFEALRLEHGSIEIPKERPKNVGTLNQFPLINVIQSNRYDGLAGQIGLRVFVDDPDQHSANYGAILISGNPFRKKVGSIDFAGAMYLLDGELHFRDILRYPPGFGPTNHAREYPEEIVISEEFANINKKIGNFPSEKILDELNLIMLELDALYGIKPLLETAKRVGAKISNPNVKSLVLKDICQHLYQCFVARQKAARELYYEVILSLCFEKQNGEFFYKEDQLLFLEKLIINNSAYFKQLIETGKQIKFRKEDQKDDHAYDRLNHLLAKKIKSVLYGEKLSFRSNSTFHRIFNSGKIERFDEDFGFKYVIKSLIGYPNKGNPYNWLEWVVTLFGAITLIKNIIKLAVEYLPAVIADFFDATFERNKHFIAKEAKDRNILITGLAYLGMAISSVLSSVFKAVELLTMRITSPIESFKQAYRFGARYNKITGLILGGLSIALTFAELLALSLVAAPVIGAVSTAISSTFIGAKIVTGLTALANTLLSIHVVAAAATFLSTSAALMGLTLLKAVPTLAAFATLVVLPFRSLFKSSIKSAWKSKRVQIVVPLVFNEANDYSSDQQINKLLQSNPAESCIEQYEPAIPANNQQATHEPAPGVDFVNGLQVNGVFGNQSRKRAIVPPIRIPNSSFEHNDDSVKTRVLTPRARAKD